MLDILSPRAQRRMHRELVLMMIRLERPYAIKVGRTLKKQFYAAAFKTLKGQVHNIDWQVDKYTDEFIRKVKRQCKITAAVFFNKVKEVLNENKSNLFYNVKTFQSDFWDFMNIWIDDYALEQVVSVNHVTKKTIRKIITNGMAEGISYREMTKKIREVGKLQEKWRATRIARTETHTAAQLSTNQAMKATGIVNMKQWLAATDARVRGPHRGANGETVPIDEKYVETGEELEYPGDPAGSGWNVVNCRCVELYKTTAREERNHAIRI